ncbi:hypothetical protein I8H84_00215 [Candidatus Saccharibacteria bacterium]|nr:hypothetical protein [Candidatus Saccharibacteria bacterium]MBH1972376.1 hypothetical protein [Candidatus Saccharibacteria bacterium]MBH1990282.1 hypothetical protein [Candidatus Saccharibacteria bacterium]OGL23707.1 MAG: hypothetical protein A2791_02625 [Candidatus Saccharibacteria bacterium RIFCSPHIGHO2_01_FULL_46_30]
MSEKLRANNLPFPTIDDSALERREIKHQHEQYRIETFTESEEPEKALIAQAIQGESYVAAGFVYKSALDDLGRLQPELDRSRGDTVIYKLATAIDEEAPDNKDQASLRILSIPSGGSLDDLAAYKYCKEVMSIEAELDLRHTIALRGPESVKEIAALSKSNEASPMSSFELIRNIVQEAIRDDTNETWLITFAQPAFDAIRGNFGGRALTQISQPVAVDVGDSRTSDELRLVPTVIKPCEVLDGLVVDIQEEQDARQQRRLCRTLFFLADGMKSEEMSDSVNSCISFLDTLRNNGQEV